MLILLHVAVVNEVNLQYMIDCGECTSIEDCNFDTVQEFDYAQTALIDEGKNHIIYWNDNIHSDPDLYIKAFIQALKYTNINYKIIEVVMKEEDVRNNFKGERY